MSALHDIRDLQTVAAGQEWYRQHGHTLNTAEHLAFINRMHALLKHESPDGNPHGDGLAAN